ncbi:MAG: UvrD-helicase domain-containing protein [Bacteroidales bacterium]|nr:UvrD-helicase domain-containing protein [Bacteroidales bacterium]
MFFVAIILGVMIPVRKKQREKKHQERLESITRLTPDVEAALAEICTFYSYSHYITESERIALNDKYAALNQAVSTIINSKELEECPQKDSFKRFHKAMSDTNGHKTANNEHFIENQLNGGAQYFDTVLAYPLDQQQRKAVVSLEDNVLVISSAGSGKTMTTVGKVRYLIDIQHVPAEKILLITFTRKAAESLSERLGEKKLKCRTFHKLALDIIGEKTGEKPTITPPDFSVQVYHKLSQKNPDFKAAIADYIIRSRYTMRDQYEYTSMQEYMQDRQKHGIQAFFKDMDGRPVFCKSDEESKICDFLGSRGIKFRYEEKYEINTVDAEHRQYCPDFSIYIASPDGQTKRVYLEHFAINEHGRCPSFFSTEDEVKYKQGIQWKRQLHQQNGTTLLETSSAGFHKGDVFQVLSRQLLGLGAVFSKATSQSVSRELVRQEENILDMLTSFNFLLKSRDKTMEDITRLVGGGPDSITVNDIIAPFVEAYRKMEEENNEIDFTDAIIRATELCNNGYRPDYDYILVDEFQDISMDRYRFLQSLRRKSPLTKLFCVGDDWQSIYRFAGSDMALFKQFENFFGYTKKCLMETTYRFGEPAIAESSKFILANPEQAVKNVHSFKLDAETKLDFLSTDGRDGVVETVKYLADQIPADKEILLLGRYGFDVNVFKNTELAVHDSKDHVYVSYGKRKMSFMTVHQSKGLECDYIILLNCNGGTIGFPSQISDSPVLKYVLSEPDAYAFSEERRVFYVGITRAKKHTWVLYDINNPSPFVKEFVKTLEPETKPGTDIPESELCPKCHCGRIKVVKKGMAKNGNPFTTYACVNERYGCDYLETKFVNLNSTHRIPYKKIWK